MSKPEDRKYLSESRFSGRNMSIFAVSFGVLASFYIYSSFAEENFSADINKDNKVDIADMSLLLSSYNQNNTQADINRDGEVNVLDLSILVEQLNKTQ